MFNKPTSGFRGGFVEHPSLSLAAQQSVTKIIFLTHVNMVTPKARAKHELLSNKLALGDFIYQKLVLATGLGVTEFTVARGMIWVTLCCAN